MSCSGCESKTCVAPLLVGKFFSHRRCGDHTRMTCYVCGDSGGKRSDWIGCSFCDENWAHLKCVALDGIKTANIQNLDWPCDSCAKEFRKMKAKKEVYKEIEEKMMKIQKICCDEMEKKIKKTETEIIEKVEELGRVTSPSYADALKIARRPVEKNLIIVESTDEQANMRQKKNEVAAALKGTQITDTRFTDKKIIMNFSSERDMNTAMSKLNTVNDVKAKNVNKKLTPKIMICNVYKDESKDELIVNLIERNDFLKSVDDIEHKIAFLFDKPAAGNTVHYILKCDPKIRKLISENGDRIKLEWGVYNVRDRYWVNVCYHCQRYGHGEKFCTAKNEAPFCKHCSERHKTEECDATVKKCINCVRFKYQETNHAVGDKRCKALRNEMINIAMNTDHGN